MMSDEQEARKRSLSEISHLFLSSVRDRQTLGAPRPTRLPPPKSAVSIDLTPEEFIASSAAGFVARTHAPPVTAVIAEHMNGSQSQRVKQYARHLASTAGRVGLIEIDASAFRLVCFDPSGADRPGADESTAEQPCDARQMIDALNELNCDVNHWLLLATSARSPESRELLRLVDNWDVLTTCDHDGVVSCYRGLKGSLEGVQERPHLSLWVIDASDAAEASRIDAKLRGVCSQFLGANLESGGVVANQAAVAEHVILSCQLTHDKSQVAGAPQWEVVCQFLQQARAAASAKSAVSANVIDADEEAALRLEPKEVSTPVVERSRELVSEEVISVHAAHAAEQPTAPRPAHSEPSIGEGVVEVIDLPGGETTPEAILSAIFRQTSAGLIECPVRPPMCPQARLAVTRRRGLVLLAAAEQGLGNLRGVGQAYRWLMENRTLVAMALPQLTIDSTLEPRLRLIVDRQDASAELLQPAFQNDSVIVQSFRRVRWGEKTGLLLEAA